MSAQRKTPDKTVAREYLRVSLDRSGQARSVDEQHGDNERSAGEHGWTLGAPYTDNDVSASRYARKARGDFARLVDDLARGRFAADVLVLWESSRGSRRVGEWVTLVELCEKRTVHIHVTTHSRTYDPGNPRDRRSLLEDAVDSEYESAKTSMRLKRAHAAGAEQGRPAGIVPYGYRREYTLTATNKRVLVGQVPDPVESKIVRELYDRLHKGHSLRAVAADLDTRGVRTRAGKPFTGRGIRQLVLQPAYTGLRGHQPGVPHGNGYTNLDTVTLTEAQWPAIVDRAVWWAVRRRLTDEKRVTTISPGKARHLLTMLPGVVCHVCDGPLRTTRRDDGGTYLQCVKGCIRVGEDELTGHVEAVLLGWLARPDVIAELRRGEDQHDDELRRVRDELADARGELAELRAAVKAGKLTVAFAVDVEPAKAARVEDLEQRERDLSAPPELAALIRPGKDVKRRWRKAPMSARRDVVRILAQPPLLGQVRVTRTPTPGRRVPVEQRVVWRRDDGDHRDGGDS